MAPIEALPVEAICRIADLCIDEIARKNEDFSKAPAALAQLNHHFHDIVNPRIHTTIVCRAAQEGRLDIIKKAHDHGADLSLAGTIKHGQKGTPLHYAIEHGHRDIVEYLVEAGVDPHVASTGLCTCYKSEAIVKLYALHTAILHTRVEGATELLVEKLGAYWSFRGMPALDEIYLGDEDDKRLADFFINLPGRQSAIGALRYALKWKDSELATRILERPDFDATFPDYHGRTPIACAALHGQLDIAKLLLQHPDADANIPQRNGITPLQIAVDNRSLPFVELLLGRTEVDAGRADKHNSTALHLAAENGELAIVKLLLDQPGLVVTSPDDEGMTPLHCAVRSRDHENHPWELVKEEGVGWHKPRGFRAQSLDIIKILLARPETNAGVRTEKGLTPLHHACLLGDIEVARLLLKRHDVDVNARALHGQTPLHLAASSRPRSGMKLMGLLLEQPGVDITDIDNDGRTILHYISGIGRHYYIPDLVIETALREGVPIDTLSTTGLTAFHQALCSGNFEIALFLLSLGADPMVSTRLKYNNSLLHIILKKPGYGPEQHELIEKLIKKGIEIDTYTDSPLANLWKEDEYNIEDVEGICSVDPVGGSDCTPLLLTAEGAYRLEGLDALLLAGADPNAPVIIRDLELEGSTKSNRQAFLSGVIRRAWDVKPSDEDISMNEKTFKVLLKHGSRIDFDGTADSPLQDACKAAEDGRSVLLKILLDNATAKNVSQSHIKEMISEYSSKTQHRSIFDMLKKFERKAFAE
ncbi:hypothetical protein ACHAPU_005595 [Fusarium lateritium]